MAIHFWRRLPQEEHQEWRNAVPIKSRRIAQHLAGILLF
jgi:hypothetical protein